MPASEGNLGVTVILPSGTCSRLEQERLDELKRRETKLAEQVEENPEIRPRRLAPQRKKRTGLAPKVLVIEGGEGANSAEKIPIDIPVNAGIEKNTEVFGMFFDDLHDHESMERTELVWDNDRDINKITKTVADWKLNIIDPSKDCSILDDEEVEEQEYHGEIESDEEYSTTKTEEVGVVEEEEIDRGFAIIEEENVSLDPAPATLPMVLVNLESLCGCAPSDKAEKDVLVTQLMGALLGSPTEEDDGIKEGKNDQKKMQKACKGDGLSLDFDSRVVELFDSGVACHVDSSSPIVVANNSQNEIVFSEEKREDTQVNPYAIVPYPEFLSSPMSDNTARSTVRLWKLLHTSHPVPVVARIFSHLRNTSRSLLWKADMHQELRRLAIVEHNEQLRRNKMEQYNEWKNSARQDRLDRLYEVRETFLLRVGMARRKLEAFVNERESRVKRELWRRRGVASENIKRHFYGKPTNAEMLADNNENGDKDYDDDGWGSVIRDDGILDEESYNDNDDNCDQEVHSKEVTELGPVGMNIFVESNIPKQSESFTKAEKTSVNDKLFHKLESITLDEIQRRKMEKVQKLRAQSYGKTNYQLVEKEEESIRESLKSNDERLAEAVLRSLEQRLESVDELLESLQEEQWADDEAAEDDEDNNNDTIAPDKMEKVDDNGMTLLDQILAMILGGLRKEFSGAKTNEEHFKYVKNQHALIIQEWKEVFGRLPPYPSAAQANIEVSNSINQDHETACEDFSATKDFGEDSYVAFRNLSDNKEMRGNFSEDNWDEVDDWDTFLP